VKPSYLAALIGFFFVAAWAALNFGDAILCLVGAAVFYLAAAFYRGELDLDDIQRRAPAGRGSRSLR